MKVTSVVFTALAASLLLFAGVVYAEQSSDQMDQQGGMMQDQQGAMMQDQQTVKQVQQALKDNGYDPGPVDGQWKPQTEDALKSFQQAKGMAATGQLDQQTLASLGVEGGAAAGGQEGGMKEEPGAMPPPDQGGAGGQGGGSY